LPLEDYNRYFLFKVPYCIPYAQKNSCPSGPEPLDWTVILTGIALAGGHYTSFAGLKKEKN